MSPNGSNGSWFDLGTNFSDDACIRVRLSPTLGLSVGDEDQPLPRTFGLSQNYPNPFNPTTLIKYDLPTRSFVQINVYNLLGQKVKTLVNDTKPAGHYTTTWNGNNEAGREVASGIYFYRLEADETTITKKMILLK